MAILEHEPVPIQGAGLTSTNAIVVSLVNSEGKLQVENG